MTEEIYKLSVFDADSGKEIDLSISFFEGKYWIYLCGHAVSVESEDFSKWVAKISQRADLARPMTVAEAAKLQSLERGNKFMREKLTALGYQATPEWFGAVADGMTDCTYALRALSEEGE